MPDLVTWASPLMGGVLSWFAESTVVAGVLAALATLGARVRRPRLGPATRHVLWLMVLVKLVAPPVVHWPWSIGPSPASTRQGPARPDGPRVALAMPPATGRAREASPISPGGLTVSHSVASPSLLGPGPGEADDPGSSPSRASFFGGLGAALVASWVAGSAVLAFRQARRVVRFRRLLGDATPAPGWIVEEAAKVGRRLSVRVPEVRVVPGLETPLLWCLGRPILLLPDGLLGTLETARWRAILAHELAHLRRRDHWVRRLELAAGLAWWWNPLYWLTLRNLDHEAELACDAWALWASPGDRITYAESLIRICSALTTTEIAAPSLGIAGTGRSFERRLTMILSGQVDRRPSAATTLAALVLAALSLPSWAAAGANSEPIAPAAKPAPLPAGDSRVEARTIDITTADDEDEAPAKDKDDAGAKSKKKRVDSLLKKEKAEAQAREMEKKFGADSDFAKKMEALGREMEKKFGADSDFAKKMEALGGSMTIISPGSDFAKKMEALGGAMTVIGPDSDLAKDLLKALGPDSDFIKEMKKLGVEISVTAQAEVMKDDRAEARKAEQKAEEVAKVEVKKSSILAQKAKEKAEEQARKAKGDAKKMREKAEAARAAAASPEVEARRRSGRIEALQARIKEMQKELNKLKAESKEKDGDEEG